MDERKEQNRQELMMAIINATRPERTGEWCWDGMAWDDSLPILHLYGDHGTPDFTLTFFANRVLVSPDRNPSWAKTVQVQDYCDLVKIASDIVATTLIVDIVGS